MFDKEPDMKCWNCDNLISHKKIKWKPRQVGIKGSTPLATALLTQSMRDLQKAMGNKEATASPNQVFGVYEYEYRGYCPKCNEEQCLFWFGEESIKRNKNPVEPKDPFFCHECKNPLKRENQIWYSVRIIENPEHDAITEPKIKELLITLCPYCKTENGYPFEYDLEYGRII